ncbi:MAG: hypothetical protein AB1651_17665, partial [Pseudomonadota bacterium]
VVPRHSTYRRGRFASEWAADLRRNGWPIWLGISGRLASEYAVDYSVVPWATFTEPEVARVGLNETEAKERNIPYEVTTFDLAELDRAIADGEAHGLVKLLTVPGKDRILGATLVGEHAGDLIAEYVLAMRQRIGLNKILGTNHIYPTLAEANKYAAGRWKQAHKPERLLRLVERFHTWRRGSGHDAVARKMDGTRDAGSERRGVGI